MRHPADVVLVGGKLLTGATGSLPELLRIAPDVKLIVQSVSADEGQTVELYRRGIRGIISRSISPDLLVRCVRRIATGETWIDNQSVNWVIEAYRAQELRSESAHAAALLPQGNGDHHLHHARQAQQGDRVSAGTTEQVIKNYLRKIYDKLGVADRLELAMYCLHNKLIKADAVSLPSSTELAI